MRILLICLTSLVSSIDSSQTFEQKRIEEIRQIDADIFELKEIKRGLEAKALRAENQADRLQFEDHYVLETRQYFKIAEKYRSQAKLVQDEIDRLELKKAEILKG